MRKYLVIYRMRRPHSHIWLCTRSLLKLLLYEENFLFFFNRLHFYIFTVLFSVSHLDSGLYPAPERPKKEENKKISCSEDLDVLSIDGLRLLFLARNQWKSKIMSILRVKSVSISTVIFSTVCHIKLGLYPNMKEQKKSRSGFRFKEFGFRIQVFTFWSVGSW